MIRMKNWLAVALLVLPLAAILWNSLTPFARPIFLRLAGTLERIGARLALPGAETTEPADFNFVPFAQAADHTVENCLNDNFGIFPSHLRDF